MERTEIIKALECCSKIAFCGAKCPYFEEGGCVRKLTGAALSLIKELTEENEELVKDLAEEIEENNRLTTENDKIITDRFGISIELDAMRGAANSYKMHNEKLTEENERLRNDRGALCSHIVYTETEKRIIIADTVREMQEKIKDYYDRPCYQPTKKHPVRHTDVQFMLSVIDQIAKEMVEGV